ncbi:hypothetical protein SASPL_146593 [Salvia splendens]|uniref:Uncharacterized protein n=1 Tax=Salvia splendens TaxID=180675 RepID=A0A8X8WCZ4_SALSN|nr:hypothetical protein SASPL_146593 [Salvia splendens]
MNPLPPTSSRRQNPTHPNQKVPRSSAVAVVSLAASASASDLIQRFSDEFLESAVKSYQLNFNLVQIGELDAPTLKQIVLPRSGNADIFNGTSTMRPDKSSTTYSANSTIHTVAHYSFSPTVRAGRRGRVCVVAGRRFAWTHRGGAVDDDFAVKSSSAEEDSWSKLSWKRQKLDRNDFRRARRRIRCLG